MSTLRARMERDLLVRGLSTNTRGVYVRAMVGPTKYYDRSPDTLTSDEGQDHLLRLIGNGRLARRGCGVAEDPIRKIPGLVRAMR